MRHGTFNNGELFVSFNQIEDAGVSRRSIAAIAELGTELGLMEVVRAETLGDLRGPNAYRLTYVPAKGQREPTDEWRRVDEAKAISLVEAFREIERRHGKTKQRRAA